MNFPSLLLETLHTYDLALFLLLNGSYRSTFLDTLMLILSNKWNFILPGLVVAFLLLQSGRKGRLVLFSALLLIPLADGSATFLKHLVGRPRPCQVLPEIHLLVTCSTSFSFPSNHAVNVFALATLFAVYYRRLSLPLFTFATLVGYSRIYLGVHYPFDVLAGGLWGSGLAFAFILLSQRFSGRGENLDLKG